MSNTYLKLLSHLRRNYHPLSKLRRSAIYSRLERVFEGTVLRKIDGLAHPVAIRRLRDISWYVGGGNLEVETRRFFHRLLKVIPVNVFWDIGANIGFFSWLVRSVRPEAELVLFEPDVLNSSLLRQTVTANNLNRITIREIAVSNTSGPNDFIRDHVSGATGHLKSVTTAGDTTTIQGLYAAQQDNEVMVECQTLDGLISSGMAAPDLIKIDVEMAEYLVVEGGERMFSVKRPMVLVEIFDTRVIEFFAKHGYNLWMIDESARNYFAAPAGMLSEHALMAPYQREF